MHTSQYKQYPHVSSTPRVTPTAQACSSPQQGCGCRTNSSHLRSWCSAHTGQEQPQSPPRRGTQRRGPVGWVLLWKGDVDLHVLRMRTLHPWEGDVDPHVLRMRTLHSCSRCCPNSPSSLQKVLDGHKLHAQNYPGPRGHRAVLGKISPRNIF